MRDLQILITLAMVAVSNYTYAQGCGIIPPDTGSCGPISPPVFENFEWSSGTGLTQVIKMLGYNASSSCFQTTSGTQYAGQLALQPTTGWGNVSRKVWISGSPGGAPVSSKCTAEGAGPVIRWTQYDNRYCDLQPETVYYLNFQNTTNCPSGVNCSSYLQRLDNGNPY
jgi:hypothetical protein